MMEHDARSASTISHPAGPTGVTPASTYSGMRGADYVAGTLRDWLRDRPALKARIARVLRRWPALDRRVRAVLRASAGADVASSGAPARPRERAGTIDGAEPADIGADAPAGSTEERTLAARMAYVTALEDALDDEAAQHRAEIDSLVREVARLRDEIAYLKR